MIKKINIIIMDNKTNNKIYKNTTHLTINVCRVDQTEITKENEKKRNEPIIII